MTRNSDTLAVTLIGLAFAIPQSWACSGSPRNNESAGASGGGGNSAIGGYTSGTSTSGSGGAGGIGGTLQTSSTVSTGGATQTGITAQTGGKSQVVTTGGATQSIGGNSGNSGNASTNSSAPHATGGIAATGGTQAQGGTHATGGIASTAGSKATGGVVGTGGSTALSCSTASPTSTSYTVDSTSVTFAVGTGRMRVQVCKEDIFRVQYTRASTIPTKSSLSVSANWDAVPFCVTEAAGVATITTARMKAKVNESTGLVSYTDLSDTALTGESSKSMTAATVQGTSTFKIATAFTSTSDEALFGLGQQPSTTSNRKNSTLRLSNSNGNIFIPILVSNKGYGLFWDNPSVGDFSSTSTTTSYTSAAGEMVDYYFFYGPTIDKVIAGYRATTGPAPLFPKWAYGLFQSKDHYGSQTEVLNVVNGYRNAKIPVDVVVQDWDYWDPYSWGSHIMDPSRYSNPTTMVNTMHTNNVHGMISIWPEYQYMANPPTGVAGDQDNYKALDAIGALFPNPTNGSNHHFYDTFNADARTLVYQQIYDKLIGKYGWDAIWADNTEPQDYPSGSVNMASATSKIGPVSFYINAYPLQHAKALYDGWRKVGPNTKRVYVLTRSAWAGIQRYSAAEWSGDIQADLATYVKQIPAGLSYGLSGMPYWTTDIGGYFGTPSEELFTRWFQFGAFCSQFRIHGQAPKELYGTQWSATGKANMLAVDQLHYRLMPYVYSLAWKITNEGYTMMRHLVFDYPKDTKVFGIADQFMYGPALLVNPVITTGATSRSVYLPSGTWYDFWTGSTATGGASVTASAPLSQIPLYVRAGSIIPMGPMIEYATQSADPLEIRIYKGQDGSFTLYEDEGDTYDYESGKYSQITFDWNDATGQLSIGARTGNFTGMLSSRTFNIVWVGASHGNGLGVTATADQIVQYDGSAVVVSAK